MDHPLRSDTNKSLRKRITSLLKHGYAIQRQSNIVFVCGGNDPGHMRRRFQDEFDNLMPGFEFFEPEFAMKNYFTLGDTTPFDIAEFEKLVAELSHSIVIFPEAPGSIAETGYFSAIPEIRSKVLLAIDLKRQKSDSFISLGPAKRIADESMFHPNIQFDYENPDFSIIADRLKQRAPLHKIKKALTIKSFADTPTLELFALINGLVDLLLIATAQDIEFFLRSLYESHISPSKMKKIISILVGSKRLIEIGEYGHLRASNTKAPFLSLKDGKKTTHDVLRIDISTELLASDKDFLSVLDGSGK